MPTDTLTFNNYEPERYARLMAVLAKDGLTLAGDSGEVKHGGVDLTYGYNPTAKVLTVVVLHGPHFVDFKGFCDKLQAFIETQQ